MGRVGKLPGDAVTRNPNSLLSRRESRRWRPSTCAPSATRAISASNGAPIASDFANVLVPAGHARTATSRWPSPISSHHQEGMPHSGSPQTCTFPQRRGSPAPPPQESYYGGVSLPSPEVCLTGGPYPSITVGRSALSKPHVDPKSTYWYFQAAPELLVLAAERLEC